MVVGHTATGKGVHNHPQPVAHYRAWTSRDHFDAAICFERASAGNHGHAMERYHTALACLAMETESTNPKDGRIFNYTRDAKRYRARAIKQIKINTK